MAAPEYVSDDGPHFVALVFPNADGDINGTKVKISDFNQANYRSLIFQVGNSLLDMDSQIIKISPFENKQKAMEYYELFMANKEQLVGVNDQSYATFAISAANYATFYKNKDIDAYASFFTTNYLEGE